MGISIRRAQLSDAAALADIYAQPRAVWGTLQLPFPSEEDWRKRLAELTDTTILLIGEYDGRAVGSLGLHQNPVRRARCKHIGQFGMAVHDDFAGRGVGSALMNAMIELADNWLGLTRLEMEVWVDNDRAIALYKRFGFEIEGVKRQFGLREGRLIDVYMMARLKPAMRPTGD